VTKITNVKLAIGSSPFRLFVTDICVFAFNLVFWSLVNERYVCKSGGLPLVKFSSLSFIQQRRSRRNERKTWHSAKRVFSQALTKQIKTVRGVTANTITRQTLLKREIEIYIDNSILILLI
jgi:hypothetical protein